MSLASQGIALVRRQVLHTRSPGTGVVYSLVNVHQPLHSLQMASQIQKSRQDQWETSPARVTSHFKFSFSSWSSGSNYYSPNCGFGWRFRGYINYSGSVNQAALYLHWEPNICAGMSLNDIAASVEIEGVGGIAGYKTTYTDWYMQMGSPHAVSGYTVNRYSQVDVTVSLLFTASSGLCFPEPPPPQSRATTALLGLVQASSRRPSPADTKFYLYSAKIGRRAARPKPLFGISSLLRNSATYWENMLSETGFKHGVPCDLFHDDPEVIQKLSGDDYDYDSDSDLESVADEPDYEPEENTTVKLSGLLVDEDGRKPEIPSPSTPKSREARPVKASGFAYAINGTAYKTLEAYIQYAYIDEIEFDSLRSSKRLELPRIARKSSFETIRCSPKSMYRFADYAGISALKEKAKRGIEQGLTKDNIVQELFSSFTSRYDDIVELETDYLIKNYADEVERAFSAVLHTKEYNSRTLVFALKRLRGGDAKSAWEMVNATTST